MPLLLLKYHLAVDVGELSLLSLSCVCVCIYNSTDVRVQPVGLCGVIFVIPDIIESP